MATLDNQQYTVGLLATLNNVLDLQSASSSLNLSLATGLSTGTAANQADKIFTDTRTIAASGTDPLDVNAGSLVDPLGVTFTVARLKLIYVRAYAANTNNVLVGGGSNPVINYLLGTTPQVVVRPGGAFFLLAPDATGYPVTAGTGDVLQIANSAGTTTVTYDIVLVGASA